jgi:hypothetical protein
VLRHVSRQAEKPQAGYEYGQCRKDAGQLADQRFEGKLRGVAFWNELDSFAGKYSFNYSSNPHLILIW